MKRSFAQLVHTLSYGDAISSETLTIDRLLGKSGYSSKIFCLHAHPKVEKFCSNISEFRSDEFTDILLHYSLGSPLNKVFSDFNSGRRIFLFHNLTPAAWFSSYNRRVYDDLVLGLEELPKVASKADLVLSDSEFNRGELAAVGIGNSEVLDFPFDSDKWNIEGNVGIKGILAGSGKKNFLHVGRLAPNKCIEDIIKSFYFYYHKINSKSHLWLIGSDTDCEIYSLELRNLVGELRLKDGVSFVGAVSDEELKAYYEISDIYLCMSEHEGFCVPLLEAMYFGTPVVAFNSSAIPTTLGPAGVLVENKSPSLVAELFEEILDNDCLREDLVRSGREQVGQFSLDRFEKSLFSLLLEDQRGQKSKVAK